MNSSETSELLTPAPVLVQPVVRRFRVSLERPLPDPRIRNPFLIRCWEGLESKVLVRTWEFEAANRDEVMMLLHEARKAGEPQVQGMTLRSIEEVSPNDQAEP